MKKHSQFTRIAVATGLVLSSSAAVLGVTSFASAKGGASARLGVTSTTVVGQQPMDGDHDGDRQHGSMGGGAKSEALAKVLNLTAAELQTQFKSGKSLADIAKTQNVAISAVTAVLIADFKTHLDAEVASGEHTQAEATAKLTEFTARVTDMVNGVRPTGGPMDGDHDGDRQDGPRGFGGPAMPGSQAPSMSGTVDGTATSA